VESKSTLSIQLAAARYRSPASRASEIYHPRWSPDGLSLYFYQIRPSYSFRKISANGGQSSEIAEGWTWGTHNAAQVDPQGKFIAYVRQEKDRPPTTMIREIETGKETVFKDLFRDPQWSKDGKSILGTDLTTGSAFALRMISICAVETGVCHQLTRGRLPRWSRDGSRIYFLREIKSGSAKSCGRSQSMARTKN
jgi:Tol biopolymer transport system component